MTNYYLMEGCCRETLKTLPDKLANCCVTSPPYFGLRDYGHAGQIGLEKTPEAYVAELVAVFREVRRVLRDDGTLWLNLGDSYASGTKGSGGTGKSTLGAASGGNSISEAGILRSQQRQAMNVRHVQCNVPDKNLLGIPWRVAFALQADGWYLRQDIIWAKPNPMPESVTDRCTKSHEYIFLLSKSPSYFYDHEAIKEPAVSDHNSGNGFAGRQGGAKHLPMSGGEGSKEQWTRGAKHSFKRKGSKRGEVGICPNSPTATHREDRKDNEYDVTKRNKRDVWTTSVRPFKGAHFATFPPELIRPCILAGSPQGGIVLDPFGGSGTTGMVALQEGRKAVLCEINPEYAAMIHSRCSPLDT